MTLTVQHIIAILEQQVELYQSMLALENDKVQVIVHNDVEQLNAIVMKERQLIKRADELEQLRITETINHFAAIGFRKRIGMMSDLIKSVYVHEEKRALVQLQDQLVKLLRELQRVNALNQQLAQQSIEYIRYSVDLLVDDPNDGVVYEHPMQSAGKRSNVGMFQSRNYSR